MNLLRKLKKIKVWCFEGSLLLWVLTRWFFFFFYLIYGSLTIWLRNFNLVEYVQWGFWLNMHIETSYSHRNFCVCSKILRLLLLFLIYIEFQPMASTSDDYIFYYQIKTLIGFWYFSISKQKKEKILIILGRVLLSIFSPSFLCVLPSI